MGRQLITNGAAGALELEGSMDPGFDRLERLGSGQYGRVWRARDRRLDKEVALKVLRVPSSSGEERAGLLNEARILASLDHPNIVRIHSIREERGDVELCLELLRGRTLEEIVRQDGPFSAREAATIGVELCRALAAIHRAGLIHCDLKPANVMRAQGGRIVLFDFGLTRSAGTDGSEGRIAGTPFFLAPEVLSTGEPGPAADLYALGVLLYYLVTGSHPIEATKIGEIMSKTAAGNLVPLLDRRPDLPAGFVSAVEHLLARAPENRPPSAGAAQRELGAFVEHEIRARRWLEGAGKTNLVLMSSLVLTVGALVVTLLLE